MRLAKEWKAVDEAEVVFNVQQQKEIKYDILSL